MKNNSNLFFLCSLIEFIGRQKKQKRGDVVAILAKDTLQRIYDYADVFHCEPIAKVADDFITMKNIPWGNFDNVAKCKYTVPDYWTIGEVYERLIEDIVTETGRDIMEVLTEVYASWIDAAISDYNTDFFYQSREYIAMCYKEGTVLE